MMKRFLARDAFALTFLVPLWALALALHVRQISTGRLALVPVQVDRVTVAAGGPDGYPRIAGFWPGSEAAAPGAAVGDAVLRVGDADLAGADPFDFVAHVYTQAGADLAVPLVIEGRAGRRTVTLSLVRSTIPWRTLPLAGGLLAAGTLLIFRRPRSSAARAIFYACSAWSLHDLAFPGGPVWQTRFWEAVYLSTAATALPLALRAFTLLPERSLARAPRWPWLFSGYALVASSWMFGVPFSSRSGHALMQVTTLAFVCLALAILTHNYVQADAGGRRQVKWILLGVYLGTAPLLGVSVLAVWLPGLWWLYEPAMIALIAIPISLFVAVADSHLFDIDRLITQAAAYTITSIVLLLGFIVLFPWLATLLAEVVDLGTLGSRVVVGTALAVIGLRGQRWFIAGVERIFFPNRRALAAEFQSLLRELAAVTDPKRLFEVAGAGLDRLLDPEFHAIYAGAGTSFEIVLCRGGLLPATLSAEGELASALVRGPLLLQEVVGRSSTPPLAALERAALESLNAAVVLPVMRAGRLFAIVALGARRWGELYTPSQIALLGVLCDTMSATLRRFEGEALAREAMQMSAALRRYVPGAVASQLERGGILAPREMEVTVLFVDIRGYSGLSEGQRAETIFSAIGHYTEVVSRIVQRFGGTIVEFNGDGMMTVFGAPDPLAEKERAAVEAGRAMVREVGQLRMGELGARLSAGVGIATGRAFVGSIRSVDRLLWSAIGNTTNLAARLQGLSREFDASIVIDSRTAAAAQAAAVGFEPRPSVIIRGREIPEDLWVLAGIEHGTTPLV